MTPSDFVRSYLGLYTNPDYNPDSVNLLAGIVDTSKDGFVLNLFILFYVHEKLNSIRYFLNEMLDIKMYLFLQAHIVC